MKIKYFSLVISAFCLLLYGCVTDRVSDNNLKGTYIDEPFLLESSDFLSPIYSSDEEFVFSFSSDSLVLSGECNDFELRYGTSSSCDIDVRVFNFAKLTWDQIGFSPPADIGCLTVPVEQDHIFSLQGFHAKEYLSYGMQMRVRMKASPPGGVSPPKARALKVNPDYYSIPILFGDRYHLRLEGLTYDGNSLWLSSVDPGWVYNLSVKGELLNKFEAPADWPKGLAFDGQNLWLSGSSIGKIYKLTRFGHILCQFTVPALYPDALVWEENKLWVIGNLYYWLYCIDPEASCVSGNAVVIYTLQTPELNCPGLAWDGNYLLMAVEKYYPPGYKLYKMTTSGEVVETYDLPVMHVSDIAWDGEALWVLNMGPKGFPSYVWNITRFKLR